MRERWSDGRVLSMKCLAFPHLHPSRGMSASTTKIIAYQCRRSISIFPRSNLILAGPPAPKATHAFHCTKACGRFSTSVFTRWMQRVDMERASDRQIVFTRCWCTVPRFKCKPITCHQLRRRPKMTIYHTYSLLSQRGGRVSVLGDPTGRGRRLRTSGLYAVPTRNPSQPRTRSWKATRLWLRAMASGFGLQASGS